MAALANLLGACTERARSTVVVNAQEAPTSEPSTPQDPIALGTAEMNLSQPEEPVPQEVPPSERAPEELAKALGCEGSYRTAFDRAFEAQAKSFASEMKARGTRGASERELWRHARLASLRTVEGATVTSAMFDSGLAGSADERDSESEAREAGRNPLEGNASEGTLVWDDPSERCKRLGALNATLAHAGEVVRARNDAFCAALAPARVAALAAQVACRVESRAGAGTGATFARLAADRAVLSPRCGDEFARACADVVRSHLASGARGACKSLSSNSASLASVQAWACGTSPTR
jgi:hypothetical protein